MTNANIVPIIDKSGSMTYNNFIGAAKTDASTFINIMHTDDNLGVVAYQSSANIIFPTNGASQLVQLANQNVINQAVSAIQGLRAGGSTNMKAAITQAHGMLASVSTPKAMILLSDGMWNTGGNPITSLPTDVPIYTITLGSHTDNYHQWVADMATIANNTHGKPYNAPGVTQLFQIYNDIAAQTIAPVSMNQASNATPFKPLLLPVTVSASSPANYFAVTWQNSATKYTPNTPSGQQINVSLEDPSGQAYQPEVTASGDRFVVLKAPSLQAGTWNVICWYSGTGTFQGWAGAYEPGSPLSLDLKADSYVIERGQPFKVTAHALDGDNTIDDFKIEATDESPKFKTEDLITKHADEIKNITIPQEALDDGVDEKTAQLNTLRDQKLAQGEADIIPRKSAPLSLSKDSSGHHIGQVVDTFVPGYHTINVKVTGKTKDGNPFTRVRMANVLVK